MALNLYRRHRKECEGSHSEDTRTGRFEEGRRGWKKCACAIHVSGTLGGKFSRRQTGTADWDEAKALVALWQQSGSWDGQDKIETPLALPATNPEPERISVDRAIAAFTAEFEEHTAPNTRRNYKFVMKQLRGFSDAKGYAAIDQRWASEDDCRSHVRQTILFDQINHLGQAYGRNGNLASGGRRFVDKGFGGSGQSFVVE
jgi:hypothetical protein